MPAILHNTPTLPATRPNWPTMYDLPSEEVGQPGMPDEFHVHQAILLNETFRPPAFVPDNFFSAVDMNLYYDPDHTGWYKRPDWFGVVGVPRLYGDHHDLRYSYVAWDEGVPPLIVIELLSEGTEDEDLGETRSVAGRPPVKWEVYEEKLQVPYYAVFSRQYTELRFFRLVAGKYEEVLGHGGRIWLPEAGLGLGLWRGRYQGVEKLWLRWYDAEGNWLLTGEERAEQEWWRAEQERRRARQADHRADQADQRADQADQRADQERRRADQADQRAERLAALLRQLGQDPERL